MIRMENANLRTAVFFRAALAVAAAVVPDAARAQSTTCTTSAVCAEYINTYTYSSANGGGTGGVAIHGEANNGIGIRGTSVTNVGFYGASGSGSYATAGVEGENTKGGSGAAGGFGLAALLNPSNAPADGVDGYGTYGGVVVSTLSKGTSAGSAGYGAYGADAAGGSSGDYNAGIFGQSYYGTGLFANASQSGPSAGVYGKLPVGVYSIAATANGTPSTTAYAFVGETNNVGLELRNTSNGASSYAATPLFFLEGSGQANNSGYYYISYSGSESLSGTLTTSKSTYVRATGSSGAAAREYTTRSTIPNVEDFGEAQLANGRAFVPIDARFGDTIDPRASYHVFITAEGDCNGLFVAQKTAAGFIVRERHGGRSSLAFQYRIVAKPVDENGARLEAMPADPIAADIARERERKPERVPKPLTPIERMSEGLGTTRLAEAIEAIRARLGTNR
jgi:hypothetical protein